VPGKPANTVIKKRGNFRGTDKETKIKGDGASILDNILKECTGGAKITRTIRP
jgi:hypothetical protein